MKYNASDAGYAKRIKITMGIQLSMVKQILLFSSFTAGGLFIPLKKDSLFAKSNPWQTYIMHTSISLSTRKEKIACRQNVYFRYTMWRIFSKIFKLFLINMINWKLMKIWKISHVLWLMWTTHVYEVFSVSNITNITNGNTTTFMLTLGSLFEQQNCWD